MNMLKSLRIVFAGTPIFAAHHLYNLLNSKHKVVAVFTQPHCNNKYKNFSYLKNNVKQLSQKYKLPIFQPTSLNNSYILKLITDLHADIIVVIAYGLILPKNILHLPKFGCINIHGSILPRWRGAAPIQRAIEAGDKQTGITIIKMNEGIDTGDIIYQSICNISPYDTSASLHNKLAKLGSSSLLLTLSMISKGNYKITKQDSTFITHAKKIKKNEARINWNLSAIQLERCIRAFNPWPISHFIIENQTIKIWNAKVKKNNNKNFYRPGTILKTDKNGIDVSTGDGILTLTKLQPSSKKIMSANDLLNSRQEIFTPGSILE